MNKQIKELAIKAGLIAPYGSDLEGLREFDYRMFAELIVRECAGIAQTYMSRFPEDHELTKQIKQHFGVEVTELDEPETPFWRPVMTNTVADLRSVVNNAMNRGEHNIAIALIELIKKNS